MHKLNIKPLKDRKDKKRISFNISLSIYDELIKATEMRYCTLTKWITRAILEKLQREEKLLK